MANEKKITVDIVVPLSGKGGVEAVINQTAGHLTKQGFQVRVVQMVYDGPAWLDEGIAFYPLRREKVNDILDFIPMYAQFMKQTYVPALVLATPWPFMALAARKALELCPDASARVIAWIHGPLEVYKKYEVGGAECLSFADKIFVLNRRTQTMLKAVLPQVPAQLVRNPVDFSRCRELVPEYSRCLLFVGRLSPEKNVPVILDAIAASDGWRLKVIGDGEERGALAEQAGRLGIAERVEFLGWQSNPWEYAQGAAGLVLASEYEAFPLAAIEALACGLPVFSVPVDGIIELVRPGENGFLFEKGNSRELAQLLDLYAAGKLPQIDAAVCRESVGAYEAKAALRDFSNLLKETVDRISVIIPCYNVADCLPQCLNSILEQKTDVKIEVICVDDKSTDNTVEVLSAWEARFPESLTVILLEENGRQGRARNLALQYASGNYVTYVDADDEVLPGYFDRLYETICENGCEVAGCGYRLAFEDQFTDVPVWNETALFDFENSTLDMQKYLMCLAWKTSPWGRLYRTQFLRENEILFAEGFFMEDILFSGRCLKYMKRYAHIPDMLYLYRYNPNGTMASEKAKDYFLDTAIVENMTADELLGCERFADCQSELAYTYFSKAFAEPVQRMWENAAFFSYDAYCYLKENVKKRFPDIGENEYLKAAGEEEMKLAFSLYRSDIPSAGMLWNIMGHGGSAGQYGVIEIAGVDFEDARLKNHWIAESEEPILIFVNRDAATGEEIVQMLQDYPYMDQTELLVLCAHAPETADWYGILMDPGLEVYAIIIRRELFARSSAFNFRLQDETNREFLCRAAEVCKPVFLTCSDVNWSRELTDQMFQTNAYLLTRYLQPLKMKGCMEAALERFETFAESYGCRKLFEEHLKQMLAMDSFYQKIYLATAPFFIIRGSDICYGVLQSFADQLAAALKKQGQRVIETKGGDGTEDVDQIHLLQTELFRGVIGFQATVMFQEVFDFVKGRRFNFWFDHPMFFHSLFEQSEKPMTFLCQDQDHADYMNDCFPNAMGVQFPPGGAAVGRPGGEKPYEIAFMGTCFDEQRMWEVVNRQDGMMRELSEACVELLLEHADMNYNELKKALLRRYPQVFERYPFAVIANHIWEATRIAPYVYRRRVIEKILELGYELHVYGESWKDYPLKEGERLVVHEQAAPEDMAAEMRKSKISLNVMSWHKAGMTERIIEIMMSGSVCLTDETRYLKEHFTQMENIVMFRLDGLDELPGLIGRLLSDEGLREAIAERAYEKVTAEHTWDVRAGQLLELVGEMEETG